MHDGSQRYIVQGIKEEVPGVSTIFLTDESRSIPSFVPGQYINVYFPELHTPEGKAYSISSGPEESTFSITVRAIGEFSNRLCTLEKGDAIAASLPYGFFCPEEEQSDLVMLAAGIGIAPFRSMIGEAQTKNKSRKMTLFHSVRTLDDAIFKSEFENLDTKLPNFSAVYCVTREQVNPSQTMAPHRINSDIIFSRIKDTAQTEFLLCGSIPFVRDMWKMLRQTEVSEDRIYTESFF